MNKILVTVAATVCLSSAGWAQSPPSANVHSFATGLNYPRGLKFGPDGNLYVAEAGSGGGTSTDRVCTQVSPPIGPYTGGLTARSGGMGVGLVEVYNLQ